MEYVGTFRGAEAAGHRRDRSGLGQVEAVRDGPGDLDAVAERARARRSRREHVVLCERRRCEGSEPHDGEGRSESTRDDALEPARPTAPVSPVGSRRGPPAQQPQSSHAVLVPPESPVRREMASARGWVTSSAASHTTVLTRSPGRAISSASRQPAREGRFANLLGVEQSPTIRGATRRSHRCGTAVWASSGPSMHRSRAEGTNSACAGRALARQRTRAASSVGHRCARAGHGGRKVPVNTGLWC